MAKYCPVIDDKVVYLDCLECEDKVCKKTSTATTDEIKAFIKNDNENKKE